MTIRKHPPTLAHGWARAHTRTHVRPGGPLHHLFETRPSLSDLSREPSPWKPTRRDAVISTHSIEP
jgi:hypothetical protein